MIPDIPCIEQKCLKLPICKTKKMIRCSVLFSYTSNSEQEKEIYKRAFPNLKFLYREITNEENK